MIIFESSMSSRYFGRGLELHLLEKLGKAIPVALGVYAALKFAELILSGKAGLLLGSGLYSVLFWAEIVIGVIIPLILFASPANRKDPRALLTGAIILLLGMILNRFNVSWFGIERLESVSYIPSLGELSISAAIFSFGIMAFGLAARFLPLFEDGENASARA
jgi:Ni/Fe-hydrogenase subunit HybB-like protein